jgi:biotin synthase
MSLQCIASPGTPLGDGTALVVGGKDLLPKATPPTALEMTRMIATCRVVLPATMVRLSAGRMGFSQGEQTLMFLAGANSIFYGEQLLTTANPEVGSSFHTTPHHLHTVHYTLPLLINTPNP